eukprot:360024-Chlamydomonas_euryale.AAC.1
MPGWERPSELRHPKFEAEYDNSGEFPHLVPPNHNHCNENSGSWPVDCRPATSSCSMPTVHRPPTIHQA